MPDNDVLSQLKSDFDAAKKSPPCELPKEKQDFPLGVYNEDDPKQDAIDQIDEILSRKYNQRDNTDT